MIMGGVPTVDRLSKLGAARISYGAIPFIVAMDTLQKEAKKALS
jgi:2-methylisocitrate lyase-like PEP mutase family enzyme